MTSDVDKFAGVFRELDSLGRDNLRLFLSKDLEAEYRPKQQKKAQKLPLHALETLVLAGEDILAQVREGVELFKVKITFPLFDLDTDLTKVQCSCMDQQRRQYDEMRCHHLYYVQDRVSRLIAADRTTTAPNQVSPLSPLDDLLALCRGTSSPDGDRELFEFRQQLLLDKQKWTVHFITQRRRRYEGNAPWETLEQDPAQDPDQLSDGVDVFTMLEKTVGQATDAVLLIPGNLPVERRRCAWKIQVLEDSTGIRLHIKLGDLELPVERFVPGRGLVAWGPCGDETATPCLYLAPLKDQESAVVERILSLKEAVAFADRERLAQFLSHLGSHRLLVTGPHPKTSQTPQTSHQVSTPTPTPVPLLRLTPFKQGGMKIQIMVQWSNHFPLTPGEGPETIRNFSELNSLTIMRDFQLERQLASRLMGLLDLDDLPEPEPWTVIAYQDELCLRVLSRLEEAKASLAFLVEWPEYLQKSQRPYQIAPPLDQGSLHTKVGEKKDWFQVEGWLEIDEGTKISLRDLLHSIRRQQKYIRLPDGRWALLSEHFSQRLAPLVAATEEDGDQNPSINLASLSMPEVSEALTAFPFSEVSQTFWHQLQRMRMRRHPTLDVPLPLGLRASLRPYQLDGFKWLQQRYDWRLGACLADDMGLGKTLQTLAILLNNYAHGPALVIAPSSLAFNWAAEAQKFTPDLKVTLLRDLPGRGAGQTFGAGEVVLASYGLVIRYAEHLAKIPWNIMVLDEAQQLKNGLTKTAQSVQSIRAQWTLALSGTPLENRLSDLWSLFRTVSPGLFGEWERFRRSFVFAIEKEQSGPAMARLKTKIEPFILRRMKKDHLHELPAKTEVDLWVELSDGERQFYEALRDEAILKVQAFTTNNLPNDQTTDQSLEPKRQMAILAALTSLRQASCHRQILDPPWTQGSTKIDLLRERLTELKAAGQSALVFSQFTRFLRLIHQDLLDHGFNLLYLDGSTSLEERREIVARFQSGAADALLISLKAGGTGLNLTQASYVFHMDPWWNPAVENQATDRAHRMGQKQAVTVYRLRARHTIEEMIHGLHGDKLALVNNLFGASLADGGGAAVRVLPNQSRGILDC